MDVSVDTKAAALQLQYIELLEKRIRQLEISTKDGKTDAAKAVVEEGKESVKVVPAIVATEDDLVKDGAANATTEKADEKTDTTTKKSRYVMARRLWDEKTASYKDEIVAESALDGDQSDEKGVAYIFRRVVENISTGNFNKKRNYSEIEVVGTELIRVLKNNIDHKYPGINLDGEKVYMQAPFAAMVHNWDQLQKEAGRDPESQVCRDLVHMLNRIERCDELVSYFKTREANLSAGVVTFDTLWTVFVPRTHIVTTSFMEIPQLLRLGSSPVPTYNSKDERGEQTLTMDAWCWDWNGKEMAKIAYQLKLQPFTGTKKIGELEFYPLKYHPNSEELKVQVLDRTRKVLKATLFCKGGSSMLRRYDGPVYITRSKVISQSLVPGQRMDDEIRDMLQGVAKMEYVNGDIISDARSFLQYASPFSQFHPLGTLRQLRYLMVSPALDGGEPIFSELDPDKLEDRMRAFPDDFLIVPSRILGYATKEKAWAQFFIDNTLDPIGKNKDKFQKELQLDDKYKELILALVESHEDQSHSDEGQIKDIKVDKGRGLVLLLHGPPGVGKTLTGETIAEATGKPLFIVSVAEIGLDAAQAEGNLEKLFNLATRWESVLLVDEADVFLEARGATSDASRNALVSVLLRVLEYYRGIIILTTNRITSIDIAVISRIHLAVRYDDLDEEQMKSIFRYFVDQLKPEWVEDITAIEMFIENTAAMFNLNGRQIRNVVSTAMATARHKKQINKGNGKLTTHELQLACRMTRDFQEELQDHVKAIRGENEARPRRR